MHLLLISLSTKNWNWREGVEIIFNSTSIISKDCTIRIASFLDDFVSYDPSSLGFAFIRCAFVRSLLLSQGPVLKSVQRHDTASARPLYPLQFVRSESHSPFYLGKNQSTVGGLETARGMGGDFRICSPLFIFLILVSLSTIKNWWIDTQDRNYPFFFDRFLSQSLCNVTQSLTLSQEPLF